MLFADGVALSTRPRGRLQCPIVLVRRVDAGCRPRRPRSRGRSVSTKPPSQEQRLGIAECRVSVEQPVRHGRRSPRRSRACARGRRVSCARGGRRHGRARPRRTRRARAWHRRTAASPSTTVACARARSARPFQAASCLSSRAGRTRGAARREQRRCARGRRDHRGPRPGPTGGRWCPPSCPSP